MQRLDNQYVAPLWMRKPVRLALGFCVNAYGIFMLFFAMGNIGLFFYNMRIRRTEEGLSVALMPVMGLLFATSAICLLLMKPRRFARKAALAPVVMVALGLILSAYAHIVATRYWMEEGRFIGYVLAGYGTGFLLAIAIRMRLIRYDEQAPLLN